MSERSIEHAWKALGGGEAEKDRSTVCAAALTTSLRERVSPCSPVSDDVCREWTSVRAQSGAQFPDKCDHGISSNSAWAADREDTWKGPQSKCVDQFAAGSAVKMTSANHSEMGRCLLGPR